MSRVPPQPTGGKDDPPGTEELEQLEELGDDAIIAQQQGAHVPKPRAQVTEEARSIVISDHPPKGSSPPPAGALDELRREIERRKPKPAAAMPGLWLWVTVGVVAFVTGGLVALFATHEDEAGVAPLPSAGAAQPAVPVSPAPSSEPPSVSIDELPIEDGKKRK